MRKKIISDIIALFVSLLATFFIVSVIILLTGKDPIFIFGKMFGEVFGTGYGFGQTLFKTTPLIICGCGIAVCFHASLFNIGAEGQLNAGAFVVSLIPLYMSDLPPILTITVALISGFIVSGIFGIIPAVIKIRKGVSEVITTIMMNFVVLALLNFFLNYYFAVPSTVRTNNVSENFMIPKFSEYFPFFQGSSLNFTLFVALAVAILTYILIYKTKFGYYIRAVGYNETASKYIGVKVNRILFTAFFVGAGVTSLVGMNFILGYKGYYELGFSNNLGFTAIAVSLLARNHPIGIIFSAFLFGILDFGGLSVNEFIPKELMLVVQAVVILSILTVNKFFENLSHKLNWN